MNGTMEIMHCTMIFKEIAFRLQGQFLESIIEHVIYTPFTQCGFSFVPSPLLNTVLITSGPF